jgi:hypothetical protein
MKLDLKHTKELLEKIALRNENRVKESCPAQSITGLNGESR